MVYKNIFSIFIKQNDSQNYYAQFEADLNLHLTLNRILTINNGSN